MLILEVGVDLGRDPSTKKAFVDRFHAARIKTPNSPYLDNQNAPVEPDIPNPQKAYHIQKGPDHFGSNTTRALGGTTLHWMRLTPRMLPEGFNMQSNFGVGVDWPIDYEDLRPYYHQAEQELGVAGNAAEQNASYPQVGGASLFKLDQEDSEEFPMEGIQPSLHDRILEQRTGKDIKFSHNGREYHTHFSPIQQARNSTSRPAVAANGKPYDVKAGHLICALAWVNAAKETPAASLFARSTPNTARGHSKHVIRAGLQRLWT